MGIVLSMLVSYAYAEFPHRGRYTKYDPRTRAKVSIVYEFFEGGHCEETIIRENRDGSVEEEKRVWNTDPNDSHCGDPNNALHGGGGIPDKVDPRYVDEIYLYRE